MLSRCGESFYRRSRIAKAIFRNGCTLYVLLRPPSPGFSVSASLFHMTHIRMHRTFGNRQVSACHIWRKRYNPNGELSDEHSYFDLFHCLISKVYHITGTLGIQSFSLSLDVVCFNSHFLTPTIIAGDVFYFSDNMFHADNLLRIKPMFFLTSPMIRLWYSVFWLHAPRDWTTSRVFRDNSIVSMRFSPIRAERIRQSLRL
jgi:hypothetical protein